MYNPFESIEATLHTIVCLLQEIKANPPSDKEEPDIISIHQASELLQLSIPTIYTLTSKSEIPYSKKGKRLYFSMKELKEWVATGRKQTTKELDNSGHQRLLKSNAKRNK